MAGTIKLVSSSGGKNPGDVMMVELLATADASDGSFPTADIVSAYGVWGTLLALQTNPGSTAPTDNYDITVVDADGADRLNSVGLNRDTASTERAVVSGAPWIAEGEVATLTIANNSVNSATIGIKLWFSRTVEMTPGLVEALSYLVDSVAVYQAASTTGGVSVYTSLDLDETEEDIKTSAGTLYWIYVMNLRTSNLYLKLYNATAANVTVGSSPAAPFATIPLASNATDDVGHMLTFGPSGIAFDTAICAAVTTGFADNDTGAPGANECIVVFGYK